MSRVLWSSVKYGYQTLVSMNVRHRILWILDIRYYRYQMAKSVGEHYLPSLVDNDLTVVNYGQ